MTKFSEMGKKNAANASPPKLGYLYQCRYALRLALSRGDDPSLGIGLESVDDVFATSITPANNSDYIEAFQLKHRIKKQGGTTNSHKDVWKTLGNWSKAVKEGRINLEKCRLLLVTTSNATKKHALAKLRASVDERDTENARNELEKAGKTSKNDVVGSAYKELMKLRLGERKKFFAAIELVESSPRIDEMRDDLLRLVWMAVSEEHAAAFVERLEGWWFDIIIEHLLDANSTVIPISAVHNQISLLREQFRSDNLPDDFVHEPVPEEELNADDARMFVKQLASIGIGSGRIKLAQENHFKAAAQRSRWIRDKVLDMEELNTFELKLIDEWQERFETYYEGCDDVTAEVLAENGGKLYEWSQLEACANPSLFIRPLFRSQYLTRGSYHMLSDQVRIGWHRDFKVLFKEEDDNENP